MHDVAIVIIIIILLTAINYCHSNNCSITQFYYYALKMYCNISCVLIECIVGDVVLRIVTGEV